MRDKEIQNFDFEISQTVVQYTTIFEANKSSHSNLWHGRMFFLLKQKSSGL